LTAFLQNHENYDKLTIPACAFITFESDDGYAEAIHYSSKSSWWARKNLSETDESEYVSIMGVQPKFISSTEPTNIIWEHRHIKGINYASRVIAAMLITAFMLIVSFSVIIAFKKTSIKYNMKFPSVDCDDIIK
jgi:hypothetical protein